MVLAVVLIGLATPAIGGSTESLAAHVGVRAIDPPLSSTLAQSKPAPETQPSRPSWLGRPSRGPEHETSPPGGSSTQGGSSPHGATSSHGATSLQGATSPQGGSSPHGATSSHGATSLQGATSPQGGSSSQGEASSLGKSSDGNSQPEQESSSQGGLSLDDQAAEDKAAVDRSTQDGRSSQRDSSPAERSQHVALSQEGLAPQDERSHYKRPAGDADSHAKSTSAASASAGGTGEQPASSSGSSGGTPTSSKSAVTAAGSVSASGQAGATPASRAGPAAPQIAAGTGQPATVSTQLRARTRRSRQARQGRPAGVSPPRAGLARTVGALVVPQHGSPRIHTLATRVRAPAHALSNPLEQIGKHIPLPVPVPDWSKPIIIALLLLAIWFGNRSRLAALRARRLERQRVGLLRDLGAMQAALVPELPASLGGLKVSVAYRPAEGPAAGGDFYDLFTPEPGKVAIMLGDVAGHGHEALTHAALTRYTLRAYLQAGLEPRSALALAGRVLVDPTGQRFATVAVGIYEAQTSKLTYALAGHPPPILLGFPTREPLTLCSSPPIGWGMPTGRRQTTVSLPAGAEACFFSDGLIEARCEGELLGGERLREILAGLGREPEAADLLEQVRAAAQGAPDDMVACVLSPEPTAGDRCIRVEELEADMSALAGVDVGHFLEGCLVPTHEIARTIGLARGIAASFGTALLRVELGPTSATATAVAPGSDRPRSRSRRAASAADQPLLEALAARVRAPA
jgi:Stage II sporulation protein E (SpoIIE)